MRAPALALALAGCGTDPPPRCAGLDLGDVTALGDPGWDLPSPFLVGSTESAIAVRAAAEDPDAVPTWDFERGEVVTLASLPSPCPDARAIATAACAERAVTVTLAAPPAEGCDDDGTLWLAIRHRPGDVDAVDIVETGAP